MCLANNGRVGLWGISYPGFYTAAGMIDAHPALKAASPQAPVTDWFTGDDWHHNGAFLLPHAFNFMAAFGHPRPEPTTRSRRAIRLPARPTATTSSCGWGRSRTSTPGISRTMCRSGTRLMQHGTYDEFWKARNLRPHLKNIKPAVMTVGGWFDAENLFGALETYKNVEAQSPGATNVSGDGPVAAWRLERWRRVEAWAACVLQQDVRVLPRADRVPVLPVLSEGQGHSQPSRRHGSSRPAPTSGRSTTTGHRTASKADRCFCEGRGGSRSNRQLTPRPSALDEYHKRPRSPGGIHRSDRDTNGGRLHDTRSARGLPPARCAGL